MRAALYSLIAVLMALLLGLALFIPGHPAGNAALGFILMVLVFLPLRAVFRGVFRRGRGDDDRPDGKDRQPTGTAGSPREGWGNAGEDR